HKACPRNGSGSNVCRRRRRRTGIAEWSRCPSPQHLPDNEQRLPPQRPGARLDPYGPKFDEARWTRLIIVGERHITGFATVGTVVQAIDPKPNIALAFANRTVLLAGAIFFTLVALLANNLLTMSCHCASARDFT